MESASAARAGAADSIGLAWLVTGRWPTLVAAAGAVMAGRSALDAPVPVPEVVAIFGLVLVSNLWLWWRVRTARVTSTTIAGALVCLDVILLSRLLLKFGGVLNPASVFYLVQIVLAALVLGRTWAWTVAGLSVLCYAGLFLAPTEDLRAAQVMHPEIALHMRGMWIAFGLTALTIAILVTRLAAAVERRDRTLEAWRDRNARAVRVAGLTTIVAGAAHELGTPLATIAVAARELERTIAVRGADPALADDARLIRAEIDRCRAILDQMAGRIAEPIGEEPQPTTCRAVVAAALERFTEAERARVVVGAVEIAVVWPTAVTAQAIGNLIRNALQASAADLTVGIDAALLSDGRVQITVVDRGAGMRPEELARAGEPFFTTKAPGSGTGLGLFVTRAAAEQLGGELALTSTAGAGTTATLTLPGNVLQSGGAQR